LSSEAIAIIIAASIGAFGTIVVGLITLIVSLRQMSKKNADDHGIVQSQLSGIKEDVSEIKNDVKSVDVRIDSHIMWHVDNPSKESIS
jgi:cation transport regulator ChaC